MVEKPDRLVATFNQNNVRDKAIYDYVQKQKEEGIKNATLIKKALVEYMEARGEFPEVVSTKSKSSKDEYKEEAPAQKESADLKQATDKRASKKEKPLIRGRGFIGFSSEDIENL